MLNPDMLTFAIIIITDDSLATVHPLAPSQMRSPSICMY